MLYSLGIRRLIAQSKVGRQKSRILRGLCYCLVAILLLSVESFMSK